MGDYEIETATDGTWPYNFRVQRSRRPFADGLLISSGFLLPDEVRFTEQTDRPHLEFERGDESLLHLARPKKKSSSLHHRYPEWDGDQSGVGGGEVGKRKTTIESEKTV